MAGEGIVKPGASKVLTANGGAIANNAVVQANGANYSIFLDGSSYPDAKFVLSSVVFSVVPTEGSLLSLYAQPLDIDGTDDAEVPEATRPTVFIGNFVVNNVAAQKPMELLVQDVPWFASYYLHNNGTGQSINAGWALKVTPCTYAPAP